MDNKDAKTQSAPAAAPVAKDRRAFMRNVVTGTVAAGIVGSTGKAQAATASICGITEVPQHAPVKAKLLFNANAEISRDRIFEVIQEVLDQTHCPYCGLGGVPDDPRGNVIDIAVSKAFLPNDVESMVVLC